MWRSWKRFFCGGSYESKSGGPADKGRRPPGWRYRRQRMAHLAPHHGRPADDTHTHTRSVRGLVVINVDATSPFRICRWHRGLSQGYSPHEPPPGRWRGWVQGLRLKSGSDTTIRRPMSYGKEGYRSIPRAVRTLSSERALSRRAEREKISARAVQEASSESNSDSSWSWRGAGTRREASRAA